MYLSLLILAAVSDSRTTSQPSASIPYSGSTPESLSAFESDIKLYLVAVAAVVLAAFYLRYKTSQQLNLSSTNNYKTTDMTNMSQINKEPADPNRIFTLKQLLEYNGVDSTKPIYLGCCGKVYDVTSAAGFYGPSGG